MQIQLRVLSVFSRCSPTFENSIKKIGVHADGVSTTELANTSAFSPLAKPVQDIYQTEIEHGYDRFLEIVSKGRQLSKTQVDKLAQGQVWFGAVMHSKMV